MKHIIIAWLVLSLFACTKDEGLLLNEGDYLIFGHFYGLCLGEECVEMFKLTDKELLEDTSDSYVASEFRFIPLDDEKFERVKDLKTAIPDQLLTSEAKTIGCPDCADQGGLYIEVVDDGKTKSWRIDKNKNSVPEYLHEFMDQVNQTILLLNSY